MEAATRRRRLTEEEEGVACTGTLTSSAECKENDSDASSPMFSAAAATTRIPGGKKASEDLPAVVAAVVGAGAEPAGLVACRDAEEKFGWDEETPRGAAAARRVDDDATAGARRAKAHAEVDEAAAMRISIVAASVHVSPRYRPLIAGQGWRGASSDKNYVAFTEKGGG
jgi:hypothetical protein